MSERPLASLKANSGRSSERECVASKCVGASEYAPTWHSWPTLANECDRESERVRKRESVASHRQECECGGGPAHEQAGGARLEPRDVGSRRAENATELRYRGLEQRRHSRDARARERLSPLSLHDTSEGAATHLPRPHRAHNHRGLRRHERSRAQGSERETHKAPRRGHLG